MIVSFPSIKKLNLETSWVFPAFFFFFFFFVYVCCAFELYVIYIKVRPVGQKGRRMKTGNIL